MTTNTQALIAWPATAVGRGPALDKGEAAHRLGRKKSGVEAMQRRTRQGTAAVAFPDPNGYAVKPGSRTTTPVAFWYERTIVAFGIKANILDAKGNVRVGPESVPVAA